MTLWAGWAGWNGEAVGSHVSRVYSSGICAGCAGEGHVVSKTGTEITYDLAHSFAVTAASARAR